MRRPVRLLAVLTILAPLAALAGPPLGKAAFTKAYVDRLQKALPGATITVVEPLQVRIRAAGREEQTAFLDNGWKSYQRAPEGLEGILAGYVGNAVESARAGEHRLDWRRVVPVIKDRAWLEESRRSLLASGAKDVAKVAEVHEEYNGELTIFYAEDRERGIAFLTDEALNQAGLRRSELRALAVKNLGALLPAIELRGENGLYLITAGGDYEASLLLLDGLWTGEYVAPKVKGDVVVAIPARDLLLVTGSQDAAGLARLREYARQAHAEASYALTPQLFVRRGGRFVRFDGT